MPESDDIQNGVSQNEITEETTEEPAVGNENGGEPPAEPAVENESGEKPLAETTAGHRGDFSKIYNGRSETHCRTYIR